MFSITRHPLASRCPIVLPIRRPRRRMKPDIDLGAGLYRCVVCEDAAIQHPCKLCGAYLYCSRGCGKKDNKKHKQSCSALALFVAGKASSDRLEAILDLPLVSLMSKHVAYVTEISRKKVQDRAEGRASSRWILSAAGMAAKPNIRRSVAESGASASPAAAAAAPTLAELAAVTDECKNLGGELAKALAVKATVSSTTHAAGIVVSEGAAAEIRKLKPRSNGDAAFRENRDAKSREGGETYEWYTGYPDKALREAFPRSARDKKTLVVGCGNSDLSEKMCEDGFRDVLSIDSSESAIAQMSARAERFNTARAKCRYQVMDAGHLEGLSAGTFAGVVDKGTIDAVLSEGLEPARRICREAMRVLEPGGAFLVISNTPAELLHVTLMSMCGPAAKPDGSPPIEVPIASGTGDGGGSGGRGGPCVYGYIVRKKGSLAKGMRGMVSVPGTRMDITQPPQNPIDESAAALEARASEPAGAASRNDLQLLELELPPEFVEQEKAGVNDGRQRVGVRGGSRPTQPQLSLEQVRGRLLEAEARANSELCLWEIDEEESRLREKSELTPTLDGETTGRLPTGGGKSRSGAPRAAGAAAPPPAGKPAEQLSLPWGLQESFSEDSICVTYELTLDTEIPSSKLLSVEIGTSRIKVVHRRRSGESPVVLLDRELFDKINASESTWSLEDKTVLSFTLYKSPPYLWRRAFKNDMPKGSAVVSRGEVGETKAGDWGVADNSSRRQESTSAAAARAGCGPSIPSPSPPVVPRNHEPPPKVGLANGIAFKAPERFLLEDHVGIKKLQLHLAKPRGFLVSTYRVSRAGPGLCEVRLECRDATRSGLPDLHLLQRAELGRADFHPDRASCYGDAAGGVFVVGVPYDGERWAAADENCGAGAWSGCAGCAGDADDEGVRLVARLRCRFCGQPITPPGKGLAVRAMPSGRWDDCIEDMICFDGPQAVPVLARDVNFARPGRCLMSQVEVLLHPRDIIRGAVVAAAAAATATEKVAAVSASSMSGETEAVPGWRSLECARCDFPLGRPATVADGHVIEGVAVAEEARGLLLLKHCVLGDDVSNQDIENGDCDAKDSAEGHAAARVGGGGSGGSGGIGGSSPSGEKPAATCPGKEGRPIVPPDTFRGVFGSRTAIKWLMGEMAYFNERDGCARFIVAAWGRSPAAPGGSLSLVLSKPNTFVSVDGGGKPGLAHRVSYREESRDEAEQRDENERRGAEGAAAAAPQRRQVGGDGSDGSGGCGKAPVESHRQTAARVPARLLEVSYAEYRTVRERLVESSWAAAASRALDPRGYTTSYLF